jgi:hypothetical protein
VGATLDETRVELDAQRARVRSTATRVESSVRRSLDVRALVGEHPVQTAAVVAGMAFLLLGGPRRTVRGISRAIRGPVDAERAYAALPLTLKHLVDDSAPGHGAAKDEARRQLALALHAWRENPKNRKKAERLASETLTPPGPSRAFWAFVEIAAVTAGGILTRQVAQRAIKNWLGGGSPGAASEPLDAPSVAAPAKAKGPGKAAATTGPAETGYSGWSGRGDSVAGPAKPPARNAAKEAAAPPTTPAATNS